MKWGRFFLTHAIFISLCAAALCFETAWMMHLSPDPEAATLVFFSTLATYNAYCLLTDFSTVGGIRTSVNNLLHLLLLTVGFGVSGYYFFHIPSFRAPVLIAGILSLFYCLPLLPFKLPSLLRNSGFLKTTLLAFVWAFVTVLLPLAQSSLSLSSLPVLLLFIFRFSFIFLLCIIFDSRDVAVDNIRNLHSLATDVSPTALKKIFYFSLMAGLALSVFAGVYFKQPAQLVRLCACELICGWLFYLSQKPRSFYFYYFLVDGMMLFSAITCYLTTF